MESLLEVVIQVVAELLQGAVDLIDLRRWRR